MEQVAGELELAGKANEKGIYTLTSADLATIGAIEQMRLDYSMSLDEAGEDQRIEKLKSLLNDMKIFMQAYEYNNYLVRANEMGFSFMDVFNNLDDTDGDVEFIRAGCDIAFTTWKNFLRRLGVGIPTYHESIKKKMLSAVFGMAYGDIDDDTFIQEYDQAVAHFGGHKSNFKFFSYAVSRLHEFDLPFDMTWIGAARSSKSTGAADLIEMGYAFRGVDMYAPMRDGQPFFKHWVDQRCIYDQQQGTDAIKSSHSDYNLFDEGFRTNDRRRSMHGKQIDMTGETNFQASKRSVNINLIQMFEDLDIRTKGKSQATIINTGRGKGLLFCDSKVIAIARDVLFEKFIDEPKLLRFSPFAIHMLKREASYVCELNWKERGAWADDFGNIYNADRDPLFAYYLRNKIEKQNEIKQKEKDALNVPAKVKAPSKVQQIRELFKQGMRIVDIARQVNVLPNYVSGAIAGL